MNRSLIFLTFLSTAFPVSLTAQGTSLGTVTVVGRRVVKLPAARKMEVRDSTQYRLPDGDTVTFGERLPSLYSVGTPLPKYNEVADPFGARYEASVGTFVSPRGMIGMTYRREPYELDGVVGYDYTGGHISDARAHTLWLGARGTFSVQSEMPLLGTFSLSSGADYIADGYKLYGNTLSRPERARGATRFSVGIGSASEQPYGLDLGMQIAAGSADDQIGDTIRGSSAVSTGIDFGLRGRLDSLGGSLHLHYITSSLQYGVVTRTPSQLLLRGVVDWRPSPSLLVSLGAVFGSAQFSDSGTTQLAMPCAAIRLDLSSLVSVHAVFSPELRTASYRDRLMESPYAERDVRLRSERVPVSLAGGVSLSAESFELKADALFESAGNTPAVIGDTGSALGRLRYGYIPESRTIGADANIRYALTNALRLEAAAQFRSSVDQATSLQLPMTPNLVLSGTLSFAATPDLTLSATAGFQGDQRTTLQAADSLNIPARLLLDLGGSYRISDALGLTAGVANLLNTKWQLWQNYQAPGLEVRAGVRGRF